MQPWGNVYHIRSRLQGEYVMHTSRQRAIRKQDEL